MRRPRIPVSTYAQAMAARRYHERNRAARNLARKMLRAGITISVPEARAMLAQSGAP